MMIARKIAPMAIRTLGSVDRWDGEPSPEVKAAVIEWVESGDVLVLPRLGFEFAAGEARFLTPAISDGKSKNVSFDPATRALGGCRLSDEARNDFAAMMARFAHGARTLVERLFPHYRDALTTRLASFRPFPVEDRPSSARKDDRRLHVDAFASRPNQGRRILRVFTNVDPAGTARVWNVGEPFEDFARRFLPQAGRYSSSIAALLARLRVTKSLRTEYDHVMLALHDRAKLDLGYQSTAPHTRCEFPPGTTWICYSDQVLHAALGGQFMLEQTFFLPVAAMLHPERAPLAVLERLCGRALVPAGRESSTAV
jgi:hypothetical protein